MIVASLTLKDIAKNFGSIKALDSVDLHIEDGEFCVLLGPSGCGKSTLLNIIAGLIPQDKGSIHLDDEPIDRYSPRERDVAMVFQNYALYPHMTVAKNLSFGLRVRKVAKEIIEERVMETARLLGIEELLDRKPKELSGGQRQRVAMGRALVRRPRVFLLDEPLSNLDARLRASVRLELKQLHRQIKGTIVYVTHDQVEAMTLGDKVVVMRDGLIRQIGPPETIYNQPVDTFVAGFIGSPEMNFLKGNILQHDGRVFLFQGDGFSFSLPGLRLNSAGNQVELGLRPEDIRIGKEHAVVFEVEVELLSDIGSEKYIHARLGRTSLTARAPKQTSFQPGQTTWLSIDPERLHVFHQGLRVASSQILPT